MRTVVAVHGMQWWSVPHDYAACFFRNLNHASSGSFHRRAVVWSGASWGPLALLLLQVPPFRAAAERAFFRVIGETDPEQVTVVAHSAGTELTRGILTRWPAAVWITCGTYPAMLGLGGPIMRGPGVRALWRRERWGPATAGAVALARRLRPNRLLPGVPWTNIYRPDDPWGAPLGPASGGRARDLNLVEPRLLSIGEHFYWDDPAFARAVARVACL